VWRNNLTSFPSFIAGDTEPQLLIKLYLFIVVLSCIENDILENIDLMISIMILPRRNVEKHLCNVVPIIGAPVLLVSFEMWWCEALSLVIAKAVASWDFN
jgi:hypothetical protein